MVRVCRSSPPRGAHERSQLLSTNVSVPRLAVASEHSRIPAPRQRTSLGRYFVGDCDSLLRGPLGQRLRSRVQLILTSPPYPLNRKKSYGNLAGDEYYEWFVKLAPLFAQLLRPNG